MSTHAYSSPLSTRYASPEMSYLFSPHFKCSTWRRLWTALAKTEMALGLPINQEQIAEMTRYIDQIDFALAEKYEKEVHHDVMAHILAYGDQCPLARSIIHLGATSSFVTDNADIIQVQTALKILAKKLVMILRQLANFAKEYRSLTCLGYTHFQPAQPTTVGKRACLWIQDFLIDLRELEYRLSQLNFLGVKGATGTQASFLALFENDQDKVIALEQGVAHLMGFKQIFTIAGQTYSRKQDVLIQNVLCGIAISSHKFATDIRLLSHLKEIREPFAEKQVGSTAMPYKQNPILSERICSIARFVIALSENPAYTASLQWLERTLDDSANRRLSIAEAFLACDSLLSLLQELTKNLVVHPQFINKHLVEELPFLITENILMTSAKKGGDRQVLHEKLRQFCLQIVEEKSDFNDFFEKITKDPTFMLNKEELQNLSCLSHLAGRAPQQVDEFLEKELFPFLKKCKKFED